MLVAFASLVLSLSPQDLPMPTATPRSPAQRFVDFAADLERAKVAVVVGALGKCKEGKREKLPDGQLGGVGSVVAMSGTQFFKVPVTVPIEVRKVLAGAPADKPVLQFEMQLARLNDGKERRQLRDAAGTPIADGMIGLFVIEPEPKGKGVRLLHLIAYDPKIDTQGEAGFGDFARDVVSVNRHLAALRAAILAVDEAKGEDAVGKARKALQELVDKRPEMLRTDDDGLLTTHVAPLEERARKRLNG